MSALPHRLDRTVVIRASRETVFGFLSNTAEWAEWWGAGSTIDARPGGRMSIRHSNGVEASGEVLEVQTPERIVFTYGYINRKPSPPGSSRVTIRLAPHPHGTLLQLTHEFDDAEARDEHLAPGHDVAGVQFEGEASIDRLLSGVAECCNFCGAPGGT